MPVVGCISQRQATPVTTLETARKMMIVEDRLTFDL